jgi:hypothetical protein
LTGGSERARIDSSGRLLVGTSTSRVVEDFPGNGPQGLIQIEAVNSDAIMSIISAGTADAGRAGTLSLGRHRNSTVGATPTIVQDGDTLGAICFAGGDGTDMRTKGASIACQVDGTPGANDMPGRLVFSVTQDGQSSPIERVRIINTGSFNTFDSSGNGVVSRSNQGAGTGTSCFIGVRSATNTTDGTVVYQVYTNGTYATISDERQKKNIETTRDGYLDDLKQLRVVKYHWNEQADSEPKELGLIAQEVEQVFPGLVPEMTENGEGETFKGIKASVLPFMLLKALQEAATKIEALEARLTAAGIE